MICYVDTSAFMAVLDADDANHATAARQWAELLESSATLVCSDYVLIETLALLQRRLGMAAVRLFSDDVVPVLAVDWATEARFGEGLLGLLTADRRELSFVDCVSFGVMRRRGVTFAFAFDRHFAEQGFRVLPDRRR